MHAIVRLATPADAESILAIYAPIVRATPISFEYEAPSVEQMRERIAGTLRDRPWLVADSGGQVLGYAYADRHRDRAAYQWSVEVSAYVRADARRTGIGRALYTVLLAIVAEQGFRNAYAVVALPNPASIAFHMALCFTPAGILHGAGYKLGAWHDVWWGERLLRERDVDPAPPAKPPQSVGPGPR